MQEEEKYYFDYPQKWDEDDNEYQTNKQKAVDFLTFLYDKKVGVQAEFKYDPSHEEEIDIRALRLDRSLTKYGRVWVYSQGIALHQAARKNNPKAHEFARWLDENVVKVTPQGESQEQHGGWNFSKNTPAGIEDDKFTDPRLVTGASAWALNGIAKYITAEIFTDLTADEQQKYKNLYAGVLDGLLFHQSEVTGLFSAGWTIYVLQNIQEDPEKRTYNELIDTVLGYPFDDVEAYKELKDNHPKLVERVKAKNVVTEHNLDMLAVLNFAIGNFSTLGLSATRQQELIEKRNDLRHGIFTLLYNEAEAHFITGRSQEGVPSIHSAIDNASWLALSANLLPEAQDGLQATQVEKLARGLLFTVTNFVKDLDYKGTKYHGAHYFLEDFEDPYILKVDRQGEVYHIEATTGLILGLSKFCDAYPDHKYTPFFRYEADIMWRVMQCFVNKHSFLYSTQVIKDLFEILESATTATWYIDTCDYFAEHAIKCPDRPVGNGSVSVLYDDALVYGIQKWGSAAEGRGKSVAFTPYDTIAPQEGKTSLQVSFDDSKGDDNWGGITIVYTGKWRNNGTSGANLSDHAKLTFYAKAEKSGFRFNAGVGVDQENDDSKDSDTTGDNIITLTSDWKQYEIDIKNLDRIDINGLMKIGFLKESFAGEGWGSGTLWLDEVRFEKAGNGPLPKEPDKKKCFLSGLFSFFS